MYGIKAVFKLSKPEIKSKFVIKVMPSKTSQLINDSCFVTESRVNTIESDINQLKKAEYDEITEITNLINIRTDNMINLMED